MFGDACHLGEEGRFVPHGNLDGRGERGERGERGVCVCYIVTLIWLCTYLHFVLQLCVVLFAGVELLAQLIPFRK